MTPADHYSGNKNANESHPGRSGVGLFAAAAADSSWIWTSDTDIAPKNRFTWLRKVVTLERVPSGATIRSGADSNARIWINGHIVARKVSRYHEERATANIIRVGEFLREGPNVVVVLHHSWGPIALEYAFPGPNGSPPQTVAR